MIAVWHTNFLKLTGTSDSLHLQCCRQTVSDLAWTPDGTSLLVSSSDSTMAMLRFEAAEIGEALTQVQKTAIAATVG